MIWVIAGTSDSYEIISRLQESIGEISRKKNQDKGILSDNKNAIIASVVTAYGQNRLAKMNVRIVQKELSRGDMRDLIKEYQVSLIIDTTHPFARNVSENAIAVSKELDIKYLRYERGELDLNVYQGEYILTAYGYEEAVEKVQQFERIFLTIGSNNLSYFTEGISNWENRLLARVLPEWAFIKKAGELGFTPANLLAMQGPFSRRLNRVLLEEYQADVLVTKASGRSGGLDTKIEAALDLKIPVLIIKRPPVNYPIVFNDMEGLIKHCLSEVKISNV